MVPSVLEPAGLSRTDGKRPDGVPLKRGKPLAARKAAGMGRDFRGIPFPEQSATAGKLFNRAETRKTLKYANIEERGYIFQPIDVQGNYGTQTETFFKCLTKNY